ncbi:MAG: helix-turn-helix domain-containing protein, partial [Nocardioides sp.]
PEQDEESHGRELHRPGSVTLVEDTQVWGDRVRPIATAGTAVEPLLIDEFAVEPADDPVVGPELVAARTRLGLTVDQLADRTRIRPHVIESIEVDDFAPCGGDFYARGHLRTLARVLGVDVAPLLTSYDQRYADAPINPRRVFEAELATGTHGSIRGTRGGPNWSVLIAAVMALVLAWSIARLIMDSPVELRGAAPILNGSAGVGNNAQKAAPAVPVVLNAAGGGAHVVVRDGSGTVVFNGNLAFGATKTLKVSPPVRVQSSDGSLETSVDGQDRGALGKTGQPAQDTLTVD